MRTWRVKLPPGVRTPFDVYINGVRQELGTDYRVAGGELLFDRELVRQKLSGWAWFIGIWGIATGTIQLLVGLRRVRLVRGQMFMVISGAGAVVAGLSFITWFGNAHAFVDLVTQYAIGGVLWYVIAATWSYLLRPARQPTPADVPQWSRAANR